jgi:hypothetical protein
MSDSPAMMQFVDDSDRVHQWCLQILSKRTNLHLDRKLFSLLNKIQQLFAVDMSHHLSGTGERKARERQLCEGETRQQIDGEELDMTGRVVSSINTWSS